MVYHPVMPYPLRKIGGGSILKARGNAAMLPSKDSPDDTIKELERVITGLDRKEKSIQSLHSNYKGVAAEYERKIAQLTLRLRDAESDAKKLSELLVARASQQIHSNSAREKEITADYERQVQDLALQLREAQKAAGDSAREQADRLKAEQALVELKAEGETRAAQAREEHFRLRDELSRAQEDLRRALGELEVEKEARAADAPENARLKTEAGFAQKELQRALGELEAEKKAHAVDVPEHARLEAEVSLLQEELRQKQGELKAEKEVLVGDAREQSRLEAELARAREELQRALGELKAEREARAGDAPERARLGAELGRAEEKLQQALAAMKLEKGPPASPGGDGGDHSSADNEALKSDLEKESALRKKADKDLKEMFEQLMKEREKFAREAEALEAQKIFFEEQVKGTMKNTLQIASEILDQRPKAAPARAEASAPEQPSVSDHAQYDVFQARLEEEMKVLAEKLARRAVEEQERLDRLAEQAPTE